LHRGAFALTPEYLEHTSRGLASGPLWFSEYGPQLSRGFRALKVWFSFKEHGIDRYAALIDRTIEHAAELARLVRAAPDLEIMAPVVTNIVCFRYVGAANARVSGAADAERELDRLNEEVRARFNRSGEGWITVTSLGGRRVLRVTVMNPRTSRSDLEQVLEGLARCAGEVESRK
jgi:glutamate/tyrosine decarboxylase-like PLP-dependent enzyme